MNATILHLHLAKEFSATPGARYISEGEFSGQEFRERILLPKFLEATVSSAILYVDLDGAEGYSTSFLEEAFGGLTREIGSSAEVLKRLELNCQDEPYLVDEIKAYIKKAIR